MAKSLRRRYSKSLEGLNAQGFFTKTGQTTAASTGNLKSFIAANVEGSLAVFDASTNNIQTAAVTAGSKYYFGQIVDGELKKSVVWTAGQVEIVGTAFDAPVFQESAVGFNGTSGDLNIDIVGGLQEFVLRVNETTPATQPFPTTEGRAVVRNSNTNDAQIASAVVVDLVSAFDYESNSDLRGFDARVAVNGASTDFTAAVTLSSAAAKGQTTLAVNTFDGADVGELIKIASAGAADSAAVYRVVSATANTITLDYPLVDDAASGTSVTQVAYTAGTTSVGIIVKANAEDVTFSIGVAEDLAAADQSTITPWKQGSGAPWQVAPMEKETQVYAGEGTQNAAFREDFGRPNQFVDEFAEPDAANKRYGLWFIKYRNQTPSMGYYNEYVEVFSYIIIGATDAANGVGGQLATVLGVGAA